MNWEVVEVNDIDTLVKHLLSYETHWLFRGHPSEKWMLESALERLLKPIGWEPDFAHRCEEFTLNEFKAKAHHYVSQEILPSSKLGWLSMMQHHGVPTRLLDFTQSPFIALFFAFDGVKPTQGDKVAIWALDYRHLMREAISFIKGQDKEFNLDYNQVQMEQDNTFELIDKNSYDVLWTTEPGVFNLRLERQKGTFLISGNIRKRISDLLPNYYSPESLKHIIIPASLANDIFVVLKKMGVNNSRLFSDIDGLGKDVKNEISHQINTALLKKTANLG